jgi:hypothetical protein
MLLFVLYARATISTAQVKLAQSDVNKSQGSLLDVTIKVEHNWRQPIQD